MSHKRSSKMLKLVLESQSDLNEDFTAEQNIRNVSPVPPEAENIWNQYTSTFGESFLHSDTSVIDDSQKITKQNTNNINPPVSITVIPIEQFAKNPNSERVVIADSFLQSDTSIIDDSQEIKQNTHNTNPPVTITVIPFEQFSTKPDSERVTSMITESFLPSDTSGLNVILNDSQEVSNQEIFSMSVEQCATLPPPPSDSERFNNEDVSDVMNNNQVLLESTPIPSPCDFYNENLVRSTPQSPNALDLNLGNYSPITATETPHSSNISSFDSSDCSSSLSTPRSSRKRQRRRDEWKDVKRKYLKNLGKAYLSRNGVSRNAKTIKDPCPSTCRLKFFTKLNAQERERIFWSFWNLGDHSRQWDFIANHTEVSDTRYPSTSKAVSRRKKTIKYFLSVCDPNTNVPEKMPVCKTMFLNTLSIGERTVQTALAKWCSGGGSISPDRRGGSRVVIIDDDIKQGVIQHVKTFKPVESHYVRKKSTKLYLDEDLTFTKMFSMYNDLCTTKNLTKKATTLRQYRDIINQNLNVSFHVPKKDICNECHVYKTNKNAITEQEKTKQEQHMRSKEKAREIKEKDKEEAKKSEDKIITACFDFQKILNCPHGNVGLFYYKRKLSMYNFTVFDLASQEGYCYMWPEVNGKHGACEVASCLLKFIEFKVGCGAKEFRFWSDNCAGQNRNRIVFSFYTYAAKKYGVKIIHRYLERGHTQNEADSVHALIERTSKNKLIYTPEQWYALVRWSKVTPPHYNVIEMSFTDFYDFKVLLNGRNWTKNSRQQKISWTKIKKVEVESHEPHIVKFRYNFDELNSMSLITQRVTAARRRSNNVSLDPNLTRLYSEHLPITVAKYNDLLSLCHGRVIPQEYHTFFQNLSTTVTVTEEQSDVDSSE